MRRAVLGAQLLLAAACARPSGPAERVVIPPGSTFRAVADSLDAHGLVGWRPWFLTVDRSG